MPRADRAGHSASLWLSTAVKSIRLGWPAGYRRAREVMGRSVRWTDLLYAQVFEDLWPSREQLPAVLELVEAGDVEALCRIETHHSRPRLTEDLARICNELGANFWTDGSAG